MAEIDFRILTLLRMFKYKNNIEKIKEDNGDLYKLVNEYLEQNGALSEFLEKPAVIERIKKIIFFNLMLGKNTKFAENGAIYEKGENYSQTLGVLKNGSILFVRDYDKKRRITTFDLMNDEVVCRYMEYSEKGYLIKEKKILIDEFGFDKECEDTFFELEKKYRETFNTIISSITPVNIMALEDNGSASITENLDNYFLNRNLQDSISDDILDDNIIDNINFDDMKESYTSYPRALEVEDTISIYEIRKNFEYLRDRYPNVEQWFINRFGKNFTQTLGKLNDDTLTESSELEKILEASESEIFVHFQNEDLDNKKITSYIKELYDKKKYFCAYIFLQKLTDDEIIKFIKDNSDLDTEFLAVVASFISEDKTKLEFLSDSESFSIFEKVQIVETLRSEESKVDFYDDNIDEILEYDRNLLEMEEESIELEDFDYANDNEHISQKVLDSLSKKENIYRFLIKLREYCKIKYEYIKEFSLDEINDVIDEDLNNLEHEEYAAILRTRKLADEDILSFLNDNWEEGLELSRKDPEVKIDGDIEYSLKVFSLLSMKNDDEKIKFLESHIDDYGADEITEILKDLGDSKKILTLGKEFNLPKHYYYELVILCSDDEKFKCLQDEEDMSEEDVSIIISAIEDMPKAFKYVAGLQEFNAMQKVRILSRIETEFYEDPDVMKKIKLKFLSDNKDEIIKNVESSEDLEFFSSYISDYGLDADKEAVIEELKEKFEEIDGK